VQPGPGGGVAKGQRVQRSKDHGLESLRVSSFLETYAIVRNLKCTALRVFEKNKISIKGEWYVLYLL
jgi:hypothetical protein